MSDGKEKTYFEQLRDYSNQEWAKNNIQYAQKKKPSAWDWMKNAGHEALVDFTDLAQLPHFDPDAAREKILKDELSARKWEGKTTSPWMLLETQGKIP